MIINLLIAESGGSKTDWCFINGSQTSFFGTNSYHPRNINADFIEEAILFWSKYSDAFDCEVRFFGAGCFQLAAQEKMKAVLRQIGFKNVSVYSDLLAASIALKLNDSWGAILGTGSVAFRADSASIFELRGGKGREAGDEGSGFYFGKLLIKALKNDQIDIEIRYEIQQIVDHSDQSDLARKAFHLKSNPSILKVHEENITLFSEHYLHEIHSIGFCGSYAFYHQDIIRNILISKGIKVTGFVERPIQFIVDQLITS